MYKSKTLKMGLHKLLFPKKHEEIDQLYEALNEMSTDRERLQRRSLDLGHQTIDTPFIPTDLGFSEAGTHDSRRGDVYVYSKDGYHLSRTDRNDRSEWLIVNYGQHLNRLIFLDNLRDGMIVLSGLGMDISMENITDDTKEVE